MEDNKREMTTDELRKKMEEMQKQYKALKKTVYEREAEEAKKKEFELNKQKEARKSEVDKSYENYIALVNAFVKDYGSYRFEKEYKTNEKDWSDFWDGWKFI